MREEVARLVFPVLMAGLRYREDLCAGGADALQRDEVQRDLAALLEQTTQAKAWIDPTSASADFKGIGYPLACWLDEIFLAADSPWQAAWKDARLEPALYRSVDRGTMFWRQARLAERLLEPDALEVFYLCVVLGFRGDLNCPYGPRETRLQEWCDTVKARLDEAQPEEYPLPPETIPTTHVPPLTGESSFRTMLRVLVICLLLAVPLVGFLLLSRH